ncbi:MAG: hypothetical protein B6241_04390 [Spirochaetaceae bacterium 4572_59]|nr:MAG: hypothetical protein B6241_04390 [Spirochaetaceae bacterium 4572_59]
MSLKNSTNQLMAKIRLDTDEEVRQVLDKAEKIREDRKKSQTGWEKREEKSWKKKEEQFSREQKERLDAVFRMERKRFFLQSQERLMRRMEEEAMHRIEDSMDSPVYREYLKSWIIEGILGLREEDVLLKGSARDLKHMDRDMLQSVQKDIFDRTAFKVKLQVQSNLPELVPGVLLESCNGRVSFNNQLPARFRRRKAQIRKIINSGLKEQNLKESIRKL